MTKLSLGKTKGGMRLGLGTNPGVREKGAALACMKEFLDARPSPCERCEDQLLGRARSRSRTERPSVPAVCNARLNLHSANRVRSVFAAWLIRFSELNMPNVKMLMGRGDRNIFADARAIFRPVKIVERSFHPTSSSLIKRELETLSSKRKCVASVPVYLVHVGNEHPREAHPHVCALFVPISHPRSVSQV